MPAETSQTLERGLRLLTLVASSQAGYSIGELSRALELNRTIVYRLAATLEQHGLVRRDASGKVGAGLGLVQLGHSMQPVLQSRAIPVLRALADEVGATAHLTIAEGDEAVALAVVEPRWTDLHVAYRVGARHRLGDGAAGKAILLGRTTVAGEEPGFVHTVGELESGAQGIAAPIRGLGALEASVGLVSLLSLSVLEPATLGPLVVRAAERVGRALA